MHANRDLGDSYIWRVPTARIEQLVSAHLGPGRVRGNESVPCFSRQVSMYLGRHVGGWSTTRIGRFYNGRHHTTVLHAVMKIERLRRTDESVDALIDVLADELGRETKPATPRAQRTNWREAMVQTVMTRISDEIKSAAGFSSQTDDRDMRVIQVKLEISTDVASGFGWDACSLHRAALEGIAARGLRSGRLSEEQVQRLLGCETITEVYRPVAHHSY